MPRTLPQRVLACLSLVLLVAACSTAATPTAPPRTIDPGASTCARPPEPTSCAAPPASAPTGTDAPASDPPSPAASPDRAPGTSRTDASGIEQVWVPGGVFTMGAEAASLAGPGWARRGFDSEHPAHEVRLSRGYWIDVTEVTVEAYRAFVADGGYEDQANWSTEGWTWLQGMGASPLPRACAGVQAPDEPQVCVNWYEAEAYAAWRGGRLPTEAEWEFAARGPESSIYPWGDEFDPALANLDGATGPVAVGSYPDGASWIGALDMTGNAMEWVADWWSSSYRDAASDDPTGPATGTIKVEKGGWWGPPDDAGSFIGRSSYRHFEDPPIYSDHHIGFRIVTSD
jgi:formylglycine-generating enzyme required for sulfatase activity